MTEPHSLNEQEMEEAVAAALAQHLSADALLPLIEALLGRRSAYRAEAEYAATDDERARWDARTAEVDRQIAVLQDEAAISGFVEFTVRTAAPRAGPETDLEDDEA